MNTQFGPDGLPFSLMDHDPYSFSCARQLVVRMDRAVDRAEGVRRRMDRRSFVWVVQSQLDGVYRHVFDARDAAGNRIMPDAEEFRLALLVCDEWREYCVAADLEFWKTLILFSNAPKMDAETLTSMEGVPVIGVASEEEVVSWAWSMSDSYVTLDLEAR